MLLVLKTDSPETYIALYKDVHSNKPLAEKSWTAGRELSKQLHQAIADLLRECAAVLKDVKGIVVYRGPGSYTGLRIAVSVANAIGYAYTIPVYGAEADTWLDASLVAVDSLKGFEPATVLYARDVYTTKPKK